MKSDIWKHCGETMKSKVRILKSGGIYVYSNSERMSLLWWRSVREINYEKVSGRGLLLILSVRSRCRCCFWISASSVCCITAQRTHDFTSHSTHVRYNSYSLRSAREHFCSILNPGIYAWALSAWSICHLSPIWGYLLHLTHLCLCSESGAFTQCLKGACALIECEIYFVFLSNRFCFYFLHETTEGVSLQSLHKILWSKSHARAVKCEGDARQRSFFFLFYKLDLTCDQILCCLFILIIRVLLYFKPTRLTRHKYLICDYAHFLTARYFPVLRLLTHCCFWAFSTHWIQHSLIWGESCLAVV